jgi:putative transposase
MPSRNTCRLDISDGYYHVYARGLCQEAIFREAADKDYFLFLMSRHLSVDATTSKLGHLYPHHRDRVELLCYCLMDNHFHLLFYQVDQGALSELMRSITVSYVAYFNRKYRRTGPLLESRFKSALIDRDAYLLHVSRYIHLNPRSWKYYPHSSLIHIRKGSEPEWLQTDRIIEQHKSRKDYIDFVADYEDSKRMIDEIRPRLANL